MSHVHATNCVITCLGEYWQKKLWRIDSNSLNSPPPKFLPYMYTHIYKKVSRDHTATKSKETRNTEDPDTEITQ